MQESSLDVHSQEQQYSWINDNNINTINKVSFILGYNADLSYLRKTTSQCFAYVFQRCIKRDEDHIVEKPPYAIHPLFWLFFFFFPFVRPVTTFSWKGANVRRIYVISSFGFERSEIISPPTVWEEVSTYVIHSRTSTAQPWEYLITFNPERISFFLKKPKALELVIDNSPVFIFISRWEKGSCFVHISGGTWLIIYLFF